MSKKIVIEPVTRVEGHGKVTIHLDEDGQVKNSFFHIVEFFLIAIYGMVADLLNQAVQVVALGERYHEESNKGRRI